jgi:hypothetical protein
VRIGILADIHENIAHLDAALGRLSRRGVDRLVVLGDILDSGRFATETVARLEAAGAVGVWGNHDVGYARPQDPEAIADIPAIVRGYLGRLADRFEIDGVLFSHIEPWRDPYDIIDSYYIDGPPDSAERARRTFAAIPQRIAIIGHFHRWLAFDANGAVPWNAPEPLVLEPASRYLLCVGAVHDGWCALLDTSAGVIEPASALLDQIRERPEPDESGREALFQELVAKVPSATLREALRGRMHEVGGPHGSILLQLLESLGDPALLDELAATLENEPGWPADRLWEALSLLEAAGVLEDRPTLTERYAELAELLHEEDASLGELASQIEDEPDGVVLALEGLAEVEPSLRAEIIEGFASQPVRPGMLEFLRLLASHPEPQTQEAARGVLETLARSHPLAAEVWQGVLMPGANRALAQAAGEVLGTELAASATPLVVVGDVDGEGRAPIAFASRDQDGWAAAVFTCDVMEGVLAVAGLHAEARADAMAVLGTVPGVSSEDHPEVAALGRELLAGCLLLSGPAAPTALWYWVERAAGGDLRPKPLPAPGLDSASAPNDDLRAASRCVLEALPSWRDTSPLALDLARELQQRARDGGPVDDPAARRLLFERRVRDRVPVLQRMLIWQALVWQVAGQEPLARSARWILASLLGPEQVLPTHPFLDAYLRRTLASPEDGSAVGQLPGAS